MFLKHFGLIEQPFGVTPDPRFLHLGAKHREALASLVYGTETNRGFLALIAKPGMGKTTLLYQYLEGLRGRARSAFLFQTGGEARTLMRHLLLDLDLECEGKDLAAMHGILNRFLVGEMNAGRRFILVIDEAQNLDEKVLEFVRLLSNFETPWKKLIHIVIAGQPQLAEKLAARSMEQLRQRISSIVRLEPLSAEEASAYIRHRLWIGGYSGASLFTVGAELLIAQTSEGIPRNINNLCFQSMSLAYALGRKQVDSLMVREAISDLDLAPIAPKRATPAFTAERIFTQRSATIGRAMPKKEARAARSRAWRLTAAFASICAALFLIAPSGAERTLGLGGVSLNAPGLVEAAQSPAPQASPTSPEGSSAESKNPYGLVVPRIDDGVAAVWKAVAAPHRDSEIESVTVRKDDTLRSLSLAHLGRFDVTALIELSSLNPEIVDPDHIEIGQTIRMPLHLRVARFEGSSQTSGALQTKMPGAPP